LGHSSFKIRTKSATIVTDPFDPKYVGLKYPPVEADIVTVSHDHPDHNQISLIKNPKKVIYGPGEYEVMGVSFLGFGSFHDAKQGSLRGKNTIYVIEGDGLRLCHLGDLGETLSDEAVSRLGNIDVLLLPVGGEYTLSPKEAIEAVGKIEPFFVLPMHYQTPGLNPAEFAKLAPREDFLKDCGLPVEKVVKLSLKKEEILEDQNAKVIVF
jgi:L-ascorbate metabolism protein UlaG (beta-lactamase superfamily)